VSRSWVQLYRRSDILARSRRPITNGTAGSTHRQDQLTYGLARANRIDKTIRALVAAGCLAIALVYAWQTYAGWKAVDRDVGRQTGNLAGSLAQQSASSFELTDSVLQRMQFWADLRGVRPPQRQLLRDLLRVRISSMKPIRELAFFDAGGRAVVRSGSAPSAETADTERRAFDYHATHPSLGPWVLAPASAVRPDSLLTVSRRFDDRHGNMAGIVIATIGISSLLPLYDAVDVGPGGRITLILSSGLTVLRSPFGQVLAGNELRNDDIAARARAATSGSFTARSPIDGQTRVVAFRRVAGFPLVVAIGFAAAETFAAWRAASIVGFFGVCGGILTFVLLARALLAEMRRNVRAQEQLALFASHDGLTGLFNRREFDVAIEREWQTGLRDGTPVALLMLDVDSFKAYNDRYGHQLGDEVLRQVAATLRETCGRPRDVVARYGGEEFVALLPATPVDGALHLAENVRRGIADRRIAHAAGEHAVVTVSIGLSTMVPTSERSPADLLRAADMLMYEAKRGGKNRVVSRADRGPMLHVPA
jgi:diguanylate cyclase (GGDEF)-like protein